MLPSNQISLIGPRLPLAGNSYVIFEPGGKTSACFTGSKLGSTSAWIDVGEPRLSAQNDGSSTWHAKSPTAPVPNGDQPRQFHGTHSGL